MKKIIISLLFSVVTLNLFSQCNNIFISQYIEGSGNNKAIEIYNPTNFAIPLTGNFSIRVYFNGSSSPTTFGLTGMLSPNSTHVIAHASADPAILAEADQTTAASWFNGDDAIELYNDFLAVSVDVIGVIGVDPGSQWTLNSVSGTVDHTLVRKQTIQSPNLTWTASGELEWDILANNTFTGLGSHTMDPCGPLPLGIDFTYTEVCAGLTTNFESFAIGGDGVYTYAWDFGDGVGTSTLENPTYTYAGAGTYTVTVVVTDGTLATASQSHTVNVFPSITSVNAIPNVTSGCSPLQVCYTTTVLGGTSPYTFDWSDGNTTQNPCINHTSTINDTLTVTDANGCELSDINTINVTSLDDAGFNFSVTTMCISDSPVTPTITGLSGGTFSGIGITNTSTGVFDPSVAGPGCVTIEYTTNGSCPNVGSFTICVNSVLDATIDPAGPFCELSIPNNLTAVDAGGTWSGNGIIDGNLGTFDASAAGVGMHTITYTIPGACGNTDTEVIEVLANAVVDIYNADTTICNDIFGFFLSAASGGTWSGVNVSDNADGTGFFSSAAITPGTYTATYTIAGQCGDAGSIEIEVFDYPVADFTYTGAITINFSDASSNATAWAWDFDDNGATSAQQNPTYTFTTNGTYDVCLTVENSIGCESVYCETITINTIGVNENPELIFSVYPNPSNGTIFMNSNTIVKSISVKDRIGKNVLTKNINALNTQISLEDVNNGFYFIEIETANGKAVKRIEIVK